MECYCIIPSGKQGQSQAVIAKTSEKLVEVLSLGCGAGLVPMMTAQAAKDLGEGTGVHITGVDSSDI